MKKSEIDSIIDNLFKFLPIVHRKLLRPALEGASVSRLHLAVMGILHEAGPLPVSEVGKRLLVSKPQMTSLITGLIKLGLVERNPGTADRRIINVSLTAKGRSDLDERKALVRRSLERKLSGLEKGEIERLCASLRDLVEIASKLG